MPGGGALLPPGRRSGSSAATKPVSTSCSGRLNPQIRQIAENSGVEGSIVASKVLENKSQTFGFDAQTEQYVDMLNAGIVDPAKACGSPRRTLVGRRSQDGHGRGDAEEEGASGRAERRRHGWHGLLMASSDLTLSASLAL